MHHMHLMLQIRCSSNSAVQGKFSCVILPDVMLSCNWQHTLWVHLITSNVHEAHKASSQSVVHLDTGSLMLYMSKSQFDNQCQHEGWPRVWPRVWPRSTLNPRSESSSIPSLIVRSSNDKWQDSKFERADLEAFPRLDEDRYQCSNEIGPLTGPHAPRTPFWPCKRKATWSKREAADMDDRQPCCTHRQALQMECNCCANKATGMQNG